LNGTATFTPRYYASAMTRLWSRPRGFFSTQPIDLALKRPLMTLLASSVFYALACGISQRPADPLKWCGVMFINAFGMTVITAAAGFVVMRITGAKRLPFAAFFSVYALSNSAALLMAWIPFAVWVAELYKWWLIGTGLTRSLGVSKWKTVLIIGASITGVVVMFKFILFFVSAGSG
jgi:hypothetical protein